VEVAAAVGDGPAVLGAVIAEPVGIGDGFAVVGFAAVGFGVVGLSVVGSAVVGSAVVGLALVGAGVVGFGVGVAASDRVGTVSDGRSADASGDLVGNDADTVGSRLLGRADAIGPPPPPPSQAVRARPRSPAVRATRSRPATRLSYNSPSSDVVPRARCRDLRQARAGHLILVMRWRGASSAPDERV
jgi:hypothetical protein